MMMLVILGYIADMDQFFVYFLIANVKNIRI